MAEEEVKNEKGIITSSLEEVLHNSMIPYAEYVILDRALPRVEDGLKPVQRRILFTMMELGLQPDKPYRKSARIVGDCLGKYHPHGDTSVYDAMVRMAQPFNMRMMLVNGHGNFGSVDGDSAAAMRYTEAKMTPLAMELLRDIEKETVKYSLNFDDTMKEPDTLPGRYPNLLVNGATGIAVGLATNIPPHNLGEVIDGVLAYIDNPKINLKNMMKLIPGPDFPTGGFIIKGDELEKAYETGKGKILIRAKVSIEKSDNDKKMIVINEIPYQVNKASLLKKILDLREEKKDLLSGISDIADESDRNGMRAVIKLKKDCDVDAILNVLYKYSDLQVSYGINMVAIAGGKPQLMGLIEIISYYVNYQREIIYKRTKFELNEAREREHILQGLVIAVKNIDEVIAIIKKSQNVSMARSALRERFALSERQAQAILDMRLARLTNLEIFKLEKELEELEKLIEKLTEIISSKQRQMEVVKDELKEIKKIYKDARRSVICESGSDVAVTSFDDAIPVESCLICYSGANNLKRITEKNYNMTSKDITEKTTANELMSIICKTETDKILLAFTNLGNCFKIPTLEIPDCKYKDKGVSLKAINSDALPNETIVKIFSTSEKLPEDKLLFFTKNGLVKMSDWSEYGLNKKSYMAVKLKDGDEVLNVEEKLADSTIFFTTSQGMGLNSLTDDIPTQGRISGGVRGVNLNDGDEVVFAGQVYGEGEIIVISNFGLAKRIIIDMITPMPRYRKGVKIIDLNQESKVAFSLNVTEPYNIVIEEENSIFTEINSESIAIESRTTKGRTLNNIKDWKIKRIIKTN